MFNVYTTPHQSALTRMEHATDLYFIAIYHLQEPNESTIVLISQLNNLHIRRKQRMKSNLINTDIKSFFQTMKFTISAQQSSLSTTLIPDSTVLPTTLIRANIRTCRNSTLILQHQSHQLQIDLYIIVYSILNRYCYPS